MRLNYSYNMAVEKAYVIRLKDNAVSETFAKRCAESCIKVQQPFEFWDAYDGIKNPIQPPKKHSDVLNLLKVTDHYLTRGEVACALSHISLWNHCIQIDQPIVVLEHDAVMLRPYVNHAVYNSICYLGSAEQVKNKWGVLPTPPHASEGPNYHFICRAHAYAIDPTVAKNMLAHVIKFGICAPLDIILRADIFPIHQNGVFAYDEHDETTIHGRPKEGRSTQLNLDLSI
jgi:hypothetical protein